MGRRFACVGLISTVSCGLFPNVDGLTSHDASLGDGASSDASIDAFPDASAACTGDAGPQPVVAGSFCIDSTEVTNVQYAAFLATNPSATSLPSYCAWKTSFQPAIAPPPGHDDYPVASTDWCDAYAYCAWAGKHLCGAVDGGSLATAGVSTAQDAWFAACSHDGNTTFPYGSSFDPTACNVPEHAAGTSLPASQVPKCVGGYGGLFNMVGNIDEWIDSCASTDAGKNDLCGRHGGSFDSPSGNVSTCTLERGAAARNRSDFDFGFRCCSDRR